jgi:hypothetical protein
LTAIVIPSWPRYCDYRELKPPREPAQLNQLCTSILAEHSDTIDLLHDHVRQMLTDGHNHGRRWACNQVRQYLATTGRDTLLEEYFAKLKLAQQTAKHLPCYNYLPDNLKLSLEIVAEPGMDHDLRIQLRDALVTVQRWDRRAEEAEQIQPRTTGSPSQKHDRKRERRERDRERTLATKGSVNKR